MRYALYFTPPKEAPLTGLASRWLGRDAFSGEIFPTPGASCLDAVEHHDITADPRRYGFHATLKAPFALAQSVTERDLLSVVEDFAARTPVFIIPELVLGQLGRFFALVPSAVYRPLQDFAADVVRAFEPFRTALSEAEMARRRPEYLSAAERANLVRWGYPYVMDEFRFHMTLTGPIKPHRQAVVRDLLEERFAAHIGRPLSVSSLSVFTEETRGSPLQVHSYLPLRGAQS